MMTLLDNYYNIQNQYIALKCTPHYFDYIGPGNDELDVEFTMAEFWAALSESNGNKALDPDTLITVQLRNLADEEGETILVEINKIWKGQALYAEWNYGT